MSEHATPRSREHAELVKVTKRQGEPEPLPESLNYGTHTLPRKFWSSSESIRQDPDYKRRRALKRDRHEQNKAEKAEQNRRRWSR